MSKPDFLPKTLKNTPTYLLQRWLDDVGLYTAFARLKGVRHMMFHELIPVVLSKLQIFLMEFEFLAISSFLV